MADLALYLTARDACVELVGGLTAEELNHTCRACPAWTIHDVFAHHIHFVGAFVAGSVPECVYTAMTGATAEERHQAGLDRDAWTQQGVNERNYHSIEGLVVEWDRIVEQMTDDHARSVLDLTMHLGDIRETLDDPTGRTSPLIDDALTTYHQRFLSPRLASVGLAVNITTADTDLTLISEDPDASVVSGPAYELLRTIGGRRSRSEANRTLRWGNTPQRACELFAVYGWAT